MKKIFKSLFILFFLMMTANIFADDWYICLGSFKEKINAQSREQVLNGKGIPSFVIEHTSKKGEKLFRVLLDEAIPTERAAEKRKVSLEKELKDKGLGIQSLWYYQPYKSSLKKRVPPLKATSGSEVPKKTDITNKEDKTVTKVDDKKEIVEPPKIEEKKETVDIVKEENKEIETEKTEVIEQVEEKAEVINEEKNFVEENNEGDKIHENVQSVSSIVEIDEDEKVNVDEDISIEISDNYQNELEELEENSEENTEEIISTEEELWVPEMPFYPIDFTQQIANLKKESSESDEEKLVPAKRSLLIKDSVSGYPISEANVRIDEKWDTLTNEIGMAPIPDEVPDGEHIILVTKEGEYVPTNSKFTLTDGEVSSISQISIPKLVDYERIQIILDWGEYPWDIDSHIIDGQKHVYYANRDVPNELNLDRDDTSSYGPETITIFSPKVESKYEYYVFNYTDQSFDGDSLSYSNARVRVFWNNTQVGEFTITPGVKGRTWHVFDIENGSEIKVYDSLINWEPRGRFDESDDNSSFVWWVDTSEETEKMEEIENEISEKIEPENVEAAKNDDENNAVETLVETPLEESETETENEKFIPEGDSIDVPAKELYKEKPEDLLKVYGTID